MILKIDGLIYDGANPLPEFPIKEKQGIEIPWLRDFILLISIVNYAKAPINLTDKSWSALFSLTKNFKPCLAKQGQADFQLQSTELFDYSSNTVRFVFARDSLAHLNPGRYLYEVSLELSGNLHSIIDLSPLTLKPALNNTA